MIDFLKPQEASIKIENLLNNSEEKFVEISKNAREKAKRYNWKGKVDQIIEVYKKLK